MKIIIIYSIIAVIYESIYVSIEWKKVKKKFLDNISIQMFLQMMSTSEAGKTIKKAFKNPFYIFIGFLLFVVASPFLFPLSIFSLIKRAIKYESEAEKRMKAEAMSIEQAKKDSEEFMKHEGVFSPEEEIIIEHEVPLEKKIFPFDIKHVALYAQDDYKRSDDIWADILRCMHADGFSPQSREEMIKILVDDISPLFMQDDIRYYTNELINSIHPMKCAEYGYFYKGNTLNKSKEESEKLEDYDYKTAILYFFLRRLEYATLTELGGLPEPNPEVLPLSKPPVE